MKVIMDSSARSYINKKSIDRSITLGVGTREGANCGCSVGGGLFPTVKIGVSPFDKDAYENVEIEGINIYFPPTVSSAFRTVTVKVEGLLFYKQLLALAS